MANFGDLITAVSQKLDQTYLSRSQVGTAINETIDYYQNEALWFNEGISVTNLVIDSNIIPNIPSAFLFELEDNGFVINYSNVNYPLKKLHPVEYDDIYLNNSSGLPFCYTYKAGQFLCYFNPDQAYQITIYYIKDYPYLVNDSDSNDWTVNCNRLIQAKTLADLLLDQRKDPERMAVYLQKAADELESIKDQSDRKRTSGFLITNNIIDTGGYFDGGFLTR